MSLMTVNAILAGVIFFTAVGSIRAMNGVTSNSMRFAIVMVLTASAGQALGMATAQWGPYLDTILYGGILAIFLANNRTGKWIRGALARRLSAAAMIGSLSIALGYGLFG